MRTTSIEKNAKIVNKFLGTKLKGEPRILYDAAGHLIVNGGKRLRPFMVIKSCQILGGKTVNAIPAASAVEMVHNFTLVHDDIMDNAYKRRGRQTLHNKYDDNTAILVGDSLLSVAYEYLLKDCNGKSKSILNSFTNGLQEICEGQSLDTEFEKRKKVSLAEYMEMIQKKTASMLKMCCEIGASLGGGRFSDVKAMSNYGLNIGIAFQIQDDLLDIIATEEKFGKQIGGDLIKGKKTYLFIKALEKSTGADHKLLRKVIENKGIRANQVRKFKELYEKLDLLNDAKRVINRYTKRALKSVSTIKKESDRDILFWLADSLIMRTR